MGEQDTEHKDEFSRPSIQNRVSDYTEMVRVRYTPPVGGCTFSVVEKLQYSLTGRIL